MPHAGSGSPNWKRAYGSWSICYQVMVPTNGATSGAGASNENLRKPLVSGTSAMESARSGATTHWDVGRGLLNAYHRKIHAAFRFWYS